MILIKINITSPLLYERLLVINGIKLTNRQIDVAACLIGRQKRNEICKILSISLSTFIEHLRKVRSIIRYSNANTQMDVLTFFETSKEYQHLKNHYVQLLIQHVFENMLHDISKCLFISRDYIINYNLNVNKNNLLNKKICKHLKLANVKFRIDKNGNDDDIIYVIPLAMLSQLTSGDQPSRNIAMIIQDTTIFNNKISMNDQYSLSKLYYDGFFELLKIIFNRPEIAKFYEEFNIKKQGYENNLFNNDMYLSCSNLTEKDVVIEKKEYSNKFINTLIKKKHHKRKIKIWWISCLFLIAILGSTNRLVIFVEQYLNLSMREASKQKMILYLPLRNKKFTGRENSFNLIKSRLNESNIGIITQTIVGAGGLGKTQLAIEYAYKAINNNEYDALLWVTAENANSINKAYSEFASNLKISINGLEPLQLRKKVHSVLLEKYRVKKILFILDNVPERHDIQQYLIELRNQWSFNSTLHVLITSRSQHWIENCLILDIFSGKEARSFVKKCLPYAKEQEINALVKELHNYPLALSQAVGYIKQHTNIKDYLKLYSSKKKQYLDISSINSDQYKETLWRTISITLDKLSDKAKEVLYSSSYLDPDNISINLFVNLSIEEKNEAIQELRKHSLIIFTKNRKIFKIHRLLQEIIRLNIQKDPLWVGKIVALAAQAAKKLELDNKDSWDNIKDWLHHIYTLQQHMSKELDTASILHDYGLIAIFFGLNELAREFYSFALKIKERCFQDKTNIGFNDTLNNIGYAELKLGEHAKANIFLNRALEVLETHYSDPDDFNLYVTLSNLGYIELYFGNYKKSKKLLERALRGVEAHYQDLTHLDLRYPLNNLGLVELSLGNYQQAKKIFEKILKILEKHYQNSSHMEFGDPLYNLGLTEGALSNYDVSLKYLERAYKVYNQHYKERMHSIMSFIYSPIMPLHELPLKSKERAVKYYQDSLAIIKKTFGDRHHFVARYHYLLGYAYEINNQSEQGKYQYQRALEIANIVDKNIKNKTIRAGYQKNIKLMKFKLVGSS